MHSTHNEFLDSVVTALYDIIRICKFCKNCAESVLRDNIAFCFQNDEQVRTLLWKMELENALASAKHGASNRACATLAGATTLVPHPQT